MMNTSFRAERIKHKQKVNLSEQGFDFALAYISKGTLEAKAHGLKFTEQNLLFLSTNSLGLETKKDTVVFILYFSACYFRDLHHVQQNFCLSHTPPEIFRSTTLLNKSLSLKKENRKLVEKVLALIFQQSAHENNMTSTFIFHQIMSLFALIEGILKDLELPVHQSYGLSQEIETYIQHNIYFPDRLQIKQIAGQFQISANYFGAFFKKKYLKSYKCYIDEMRIQLIEERLASPRYTMRQIVDELGFNDESHLTNFYKKKRHMTPSVYRRSRNTG
ncbi:helix-turn-helix domain-containing protein [Sphingobacterium thalpophilum]|uniref:helix-turn-helix domain-containing protein n=1 Tax=Sphingobacterium thalpophilum TaxID=259 RepID=UPI0024A75D39|nr:AraC family transcriptional regulator [Sphingobacterium thalpophilum]